MKQKELESYLQNVDGFSRPKIKLEQYQTSAHLAARILFQADSNYDSVRSKSVLDLGCGSGVFTAGSLLLDADYVLGVDIDAEALEDCRGNLEELFEDERLNYDLVQADVNCDRTFERFFKAFDTVVMNPPFGTKNKGVDMVFLKRAIDCARESVYSLHKTSTREFIVRKCKEWDVKCEVLAELRFDLPQMYKCHKKSSVDIEVDLIRLSFK